MTTHVLMITDMSGSMHPLAEDVRGGFNSYVQDLRGEANADDYRLTVTVFDTAFEKLCVAAPLADVPTLTEANYQPRGMTALLDAVGKAVAEFDAAAKGALPPGSDDVTGDDRVLVVIQTDGEENCSTEYGYEQIRKLIADREATGKWSFAYLGAGASAWAQGGKLGVQRSSIIQTVNTSAGTRASYSGLYAGTVAYSSGAPAGTVSGIIANEAGAQ